MGRLISGLVKLAAVAGVAAAVKKFSEKDNRDAVVNEYNKAKENPKDYAQNVQNKVSEKANKVQGKAKEEYSKAKEDPKQYAQNVQSKATEQAKGYQNKMTEQAKQYQEKAKTEFNKAKEDPKGYAENVQSKVKKENHDVKPDAVDGGGHLTTDQEEGTFDSEGGAVHPEENPNSEVVKDKDEIDDNHNIHVVYDEDLDEDNKK